MAADAGGAGAIPTRSLQETPTWALATVCFIFIFLGLFIEQLIHLLGHWLKKRRKNALFEAVEKLKSVLMLLGFMSLILAVTQRSISKICIPNRVANSMLPCRRSAPTKTTKALGYDLKWFQNSLSTEEVFQDLISHHERRLATPAATTGGARNSLSHCDSKGMTSLISQQGLTQLNNFIFVLAAMQIVYSVVTMALGRAKMRRWKVWEKETQTVEYQAANDPNRFRFIRQTTFGRRHMSSCTTTSTQLWIKCFFRQFFHSVAKVDYLTLRHGFIAAHLSTNNTFNFRKYIQRSLEDDFKVVVGINPFMWLLVVIFLLVDVHGWHVYLWVSFLPLIIVLVLGTKLEVIVAEMALKLKDQNSVIKGAPVVQPNDKLFWFSHPNFVLTLLHFTLFMNAFEFAFFLWVTLQFGIKSCYHERVEIIVIRVVLAVMMGSNFKSAVLEEQTVHVIRQWHAEVRDKRKKRSPLSQSPLPESSTPWTNSTTNSPDLSISYHRTPTLAEFSSRGGATVSEITEDRQEITQLEPTSSSIRDLQIQMPEMNSTNNSKF
ncbi:hypothetical protein F0562_021805 [Nyssa sinensis]|uniref:MLO-like protein n=1 Tax=Nyssa sinensis TaxID=561372 RepID=A0A5J5BMR5_9ASTE|nr:hypothetical protein F0562_021805 [Nyssa sinensis]